jgi:hypothetical protein
MKLKDYIKSLQNVIDEDPETADYKVVYAIDDEGNGFGLVGHSPTFGNYKDGEFDTEDENINSICIN